MASKSIATSPERPSRPARTYRSALRQEQAAQTRQRVVAAAAELFAGLGFARTTLAKIASAAGVSVETVQAQGSKAELLVAAIEFSSFGVIGDHNILDLDVGRRFVELTERDDAIELFVAEQTAVHERSGAVTMALFGAAAGDPTLNGFLDALVAGIGRQIRRLLEICRDRGWLRDDLPFDELVETTVVIASIETYMRMVDRDGWSVEAYRAWFRRMLDEVVFGPIPGEQTRRAGTSG